MCGSMADIQFATVEIRRGKKKIEEEEEETAGQKYNVRNSASAMQGGHNHTLFYRITSSHFIWNAYFKSGNLDKGDAILAYYETRMWANAQPDGRPAEQRWRPLFNAAKFG